MHVIDGVFYTRKATGIQRFALNVVKEMDHLVPKGTMQIVVPEYCDAEIDYENIEVVRFGKQKNGYIWEQTDLAWYLLKTGADGLFIENAAPFFCRRGIVVLHDISYKVNPKFFCTSLRGCYGDFVCRCLYRVIMDSRMKIVTVSDFSKNEIIREYHINPARITVAGNGWQHMNEIEEDKHVLDSLGVMEGQYYFAMATNAPNKNFKWIISAARAYAAEKFVIAGNLTEGLRDVGITDNVIPAGYITDEEAKALMAHCKAFLFPTFYEGFGIPPLEAVACGARNIIVSDTPCMHEIYGNVAGYIDPYDYRNIMLPERHIAEFEVKELLSKYSWKKTAERIVQLL